MNLLKSFELMCMFGMFNKLETYSFVNCVSVSIENESKLMPTLNTFGGV